MEFPIKKSVRFANGKNTFIYFEQNECSFDSETVRASHNRSSVEKTILNNPQSYLKLIKDLISSCRHQDISIVFGNLGRQPFLINYFLDMCFSYEENVKITCRWNLSSEYQSETSKNADFEFLVEPKFGSTIHKDPDVKHLIILTSHLSLFYCGSSNQIRYYYLNFSNMKLTNFSNPDLQNCEIFKPPIFHKQVYNTILPESILLDVSDSQTAHEAYLRILTGCEIIRNRPYKICMTERDKEILKINLKKTEKFFKYVGKQWETNSFNMGNYHPDYFLYNFLGMS